MSIHAKLIGGLSAAALILVPVVPASAHGRRPPPRWHHHDRHDDSGAVVGVVAAVGLIALLAAASSAKKKAREAQAGARGPDDEERIGDGRIGDRPIGDRAGEPGWDEDGRAALGSREEAVDACALAARDEGTRLGGYAEMRGVTGSDERGDGWDVRGTIVQRASYGAVGQLRDFRCTYRGGRVQDVALS